ncbi:MAG: response regulator transcription factor [Methylomonas sp.]
MKVNDQDALVYLVDDEFAIRDSLTLLIESTGRKVRSFDSSKDFLDHYDSGRPGCLILDVRMPTMGGLELQDELAGRNINIPIIFISGNADIPDSAKAFRSGALDFMKKPFDNQILLERIEEAIEKDIANRNKLAEKQKIQSCFNRLTSREKEVLQLIIASHSNKEAAKILAVSHRTVDAHRARVMEKMQAENVASLVTMVLSYGLLNEPATLSDARSEPA